jgi:hypothetical protein
MLMADPNLEESIIKQVSRLLNKLVKQAVFHTARNILPTLEQLWSRFHRHVHTNFASWRPTGSFVG